MSSILMPNGNGEDVTDLSPISCNGGDDRLYKTLHCCFTKVVLFDGDGFSKPLLESQCEISYLESQTLTEYESMSEIEKLNEKKQLKIGMSEGTHSMGLEAMLMTMKRGETSRFHVWWKSTQIPLLDAGEKGFNHPEKEHYIILVLHDFTDATPIWHLDPDQKYDLSLQHKHHGTSFFKEDKVEPAFCQYSLALKYMISIAISMVSDESQKQKYKQLKCICYLNLAACQIKTENFLSVVENCTKGLTLDVWNVKGLYRRALAYKNLGKLDEARSDLVKIIKKEPRNKTAADLLESLMPSNVDDVENDTS